MTNSADPDQLASSEANDLDLHCLQRQGISGISKTRANKHFSFFFTKTCCGYSLGHLAKVFLLSIHNMCFHREIR